MNPANARVYVKFVDGVEVFIPIDAVLVSENIYQLLADDEFDYDDNAVLFEFGSRDVVKTYPPKNENWLPTAYELITAGDERNLQKRLLIRILLNSPEPQEIFGEVSQNEIKSVCQKIEEATFGYPDIKKWFSLHKETIKGLLKN